MKLVKYVYDISLFDSVFSIIMKKTDEYFYSEVILKDIENKKAEKEYFSAFLWDF